MTAKPLIGPLTPAVMANLGVALALAVWPLFLLGAGVLIGRLWGLPAGASAGDVSLHQNIGRFILALSAGALMSATWFAGRSWLEARKRALLTMGICYIPAVAFAITNFTHH